MKSLLCLASLTLMTTIAMAANPAEFDVSQCNTFGYGAPAELGTISEQNDARIVVQCLDRSLSIRVDIPQSEYRNLYHSPYLYEKRPDRSNVGTISVSHLSVRSYDGIFLRFEADGRVYAYNIADKIGAMKGYRTED